MTAIRHEPAATALDDATRAEMLRIGSNVRAEIARQYLSQREVAEQVGMSQQNLSRRIHGQIRFSDRELRDIAAILKIKLEVLIGK